MGVGLHDLEALMPSVIPDDSEEYLTAQGYVFEGVGLWCGHMAKAALRDLGIDGADPRYQELGPAFTNVALCAFEMGVRSKPAEVPERVRSIGKHFEEESYVG